MAIVPRRSLGAAPRIALVAMAIVLLLGLSLAIAFDQAALGFGIVFVAALPVMLYAAYRWPIVFPLGLYVVSVPFDPLLKTAGGSGGTLTRFIGIATIVALVIHAFRMRRLFAPPSSWYAWGAYIFLAFLSLAWSIDYQGTSSVLGIMFSLFALYTVTAMYPITPESYVTVRRSVVAAGALTALYGVYGYFSGQRLGAARLSLSFNHVHFDPNHYAAFFCIPIGVVSARLFVSRNRRDQYVAAALLLPMFGNVLLSGSRGALIAATLLMLYIGVRARRYVLLGAVALGGLAFTFVVPNVWVRILDPTQGDASGRGEIWSVGFAAIREYGLYGSGFGSFLTAYDENINHSIQKTFVGYSRPAHNIVIQTTAELGIAGIVLLLVAFWTAFRQNAFIPRASAYFADRCAYEGAILGIFVSALTIDLLWFKYIWLCLSMIVLLTNAVRPTILLGRRFSTAPRRTAMRAEAVREPVPL